METIETPVSPLVNEFLDAVHTGLRARADSGHLAQKEAGTAFAFVNALKKGHFYLQDEPWHDLQGTEQRYPSEMLMRALMPDMDVISPLKPITTIGECGLHAPFDKAVILVAVDQALRENLKNISINTSARNIGDPEFWTDVKNLLKEHFGERLKNIRLTFEITEDDLASKPCRDVLRAMKEELGCCFAVDDFYHDRQRCLDDGLTVGSHDWQRLENLGCSETDEAGHTLTPIVDYVKIDGDTVRAALQGGVDLDPILDRIMSTCPHVKIIAEKVRTIEEASFLRDRYPVITAIQGMHLSHNLSQVRRELAATANGSNSGHALPHRPAVSISL